METGDSAFPIKAGSQYVCAGDCTHAHSLFRKQTVTHVRRNGKIFTILILATPSSLTAGDHRKDGAPTPGFQSAVTCDASNARLQYKGCLLEVQSTPTCKAIRHLFPHNDISI